MEKIKNLFLVIALIITGGGIAALLVFVPDWVVNAQSSQIDVSIGPDVCPNLAGSQLVVPVGMVIDENGDCVTPPTDQCPNITGTQETVPDGMVKDADGNCFTPTPPPTDVCPNLSGNQSAIPDGYYKANDGNCYKQTTPPKDVCPNIAGTQETVPDGMINDESGNCIEPPKDECPNIGGTQSTIPEGMLKDNNGNCYTPEDEPAPFVPQPTAPNGSSGNESSGNFSIPKNVPAFLAPAIQPLINLVPESVKQAVKSLPPIVAKSFPYYIFAILGIVSVLMMWQAIRETISAKRLFTILNREKLIAEEKDNFIALSSHYLHTPLTVMRNGVDTIAALKELPEAQVSPLSAAIGGLKERIDAILNDVESNSALKSISAPNISALKVKTLASPYFWIPVVASASITLFSNFLLGVVGEVDLGIGNLTGQLIVFGAVSLLLYNTLRTRHLRIVERANTERLLAHEHAIDAARNTFIQQSTLALTEGLQVVQNYRTAITGAPSAKYFEDGFQRFANMLAKFNLLSQIETGASGAMVTFNMRDAVNGSLVQHQNEITEKKLTITNTVGDIEVLQNQVLFGFVLNSVIDNAIKFSKEGGNITISTAPSSHTMQINVIDTGIGVPQDKLPHLFKPFSRAGSALQFDYEGLGFSLFLDKIIMDYLGGEISAASEPDKGTVVTVTA